MKSVLVALLALGVSAPGSILLAADHSVSMGHHHMNTGNLEASRHFWELIGARPVKFGKSEVMKLPDLLIFFREQEPTGGTKGTTVNHIGIRLRDVRAKVDELRKAGVPIVTQQEMPGAKEDVYFNEPQKTYLAYVMSPDGTKVELFEDPSAPLPAANHHIHFAAPDVAAMKAWYVDTFGAEPGTRGGMEAAQLPGVNLTFSPAAGEVTGTKGRAIDHIGFEVKGLKAFCEQLEKKGIKLDRPYSELPDMGIALAFLTDPWGTYIELTEGLDKL
jgi:catechol 2,3-dioxygenase-like lactoylglutathione lyase family enzyme